MDITTISVYILLFFIYSFGGWLIETIGDLLIKKRFVNRGFLLGPYCPIYGCGVLLITFCLSRYQDDMVALFFFSALLCGTLEYTTSYLMEKLFHTRWWDYSHLKGSINGRICLETLLLFAIAGILIFKVSNPFFISLLMKLPTVCLLFLASCLSILFLVDVFASFHFINSIKKIQTSVTDQWKDNTEEISTRVREIILQKSLPYRRLLAAFPQAFASKLKERKRTN